MPEYSNLQDTAYYVFDTRVFRQRIRHVRQLLGPDMALAYAIKANPFLTGFALGRRKNWRSAPRGSAASVMRWVFLRKPR